MKECDKSLKKKNKKGLSGIVITLIIIVLSLVAIGVVWGVVRAVIKSNSGQIQTGSLTVDLAITNAYEQSGAINVYVKRNVGEGEITKIKFVLSDGANSEVVTKEVTNFGELKSQSFVLNPVELISSAILTVSVAPVLTASDGKDIIGEITSTYTLSRGSLPGDTDGDGLSDAQETALGTNPNSADTDNDGFSDGNEVTAGTDPNDANSHPTSPGCTPDCGSKVCGPAPNACEGADACGICISGTCSEDGLSCVGCTPIASCPAERICGTMSNGCGGELTCGTCPTGICNSLGTLCEAIVPLNSGIVEDVWPENFGLYFGSSSLPTDINYQGKYVKFPGSTETHCLSILIYRFPVGGYTKSHVGFNFGTLIAVGNSYQIFATYEECNAS
jgi:hypothetical protein